MNSKIIVSKTSIAAEQVQQIPLSQIDPCPVNPRKNYDEAQLGELTASIAKMGITNPVIVRPAKRDFYVSHGFGSEEGMVFYLACKNSVGHENLIETFSHGTKEENEAAAANAAREKNPKGDYELIAGHRRVEAAKRAGLLEAPSIVRELNDREALDLAIVDNLNRVDLSPMEEADGYRTLLKAMGAETSTVEDHAGEIALKVGKTLRYVVQRIKLLSLIPEAQDVMRQALLDLDKAMLIARLQPEDQGNALLYAIDNRKAAHGKTLQERVASAVKNLKGENPHWYRQSTEKELREWIDNNITLSLKKAIWALDDADLLPAAGACTTCPKRVGNNTVLFGDLTSKEDTCTDPSCYESKQKAFVKLTVKESAESGAPVLKLTTSHSHLPIKEGSDLLKTTFKQGQWVEAKKGSCPDTHRGVTQEGQFKTVCVNQKCKVHKHQVQQPQARGERVSYQEQKRRQEEAQERRELLEKTERPIRNKIFAVVLAKLETAKALRMVADAQRDHTQIRKVVFEQFPKVKGVDLEALVLFYAEFAHRSQTNGYWLSQEGGVKKDREFLWDLAKSLGVDANVIAAKHFHDAGSIAPAAEVLYPKGIPWPKRADDASVIKKTSPVKPVKGQKSKPVVLSPEARKRIAAAMKKRWAEKTQKAGRK